MKATFENHGTESVYSGTSAHLSYPGQRTHTLIRIQAFSWF